MPVVILLANVDEGFLRPNDVLGRLGNIRKTTTYRVASSELLLRADDGSAALSCVEGTLASHDSLTSCPTASGLAADFGHGVPVVRHCGGYAGDL